jgi:hypothetical protein
MRRFLAGVSNVGEMWIELAGFCQAGPAGIAAFVTLSPVALVLTVPAFVAGVMRGRP